MLTFIIVVLCLIVSVLFIGVSIQENQITELENKFSNSQKCSSDNNYQKDFDYLEKLIYNLDKQGTRLIKSIASELGKEIKKVKVIESNCGVDKIVTNYDLVDLPKVKKTK